MKLKHSIIALVALCSMAFTSCGDDNGGDETQVTGKVNITISTTMNDQYKKCIVETVDYTVNDATGKIVRSEIKHNMIYPVEITNIKAPAVVVFKRTFEKNPDTEVISENISLSRSQKDIVELVGSSLWKDENSKSMEMSSENLDDFIASMNSSAKRHTLVVTKEGSIIHTDK